MRTPPATCVRSIVVLVLLASVSSVASADDARRKQPRWAAEACQVKLPAGTLAALERDHLAITDEARLDVFDFYPYDELPVFITSDSILAAYRGLLEGTFVNDEVVNAAKVELLLRTVVKRLPDADKQFRTNASLKNAAMKRARVVTGVALRLLDDGFRFGNRSLDALIAAECKAVVAARSIATPTWYGKHVPLVTAIDYSRFKPRGF